MRRLISAWGIFPIFQPRRDDQIRANPPARLIRLPGTPDAHTGSTIHGDLNARDSAPRSAFEPRAQGAPGDAVPGRGEPNGGGLGGGQAVRLVGWRRGGAGCCGASSPYPGSRARRPARVQSVLIDT